MNDTEILKEMLRSDAHVPLPHTDSRRSVKLTDKESATTVEIKGIPQDSVVIKADNFVSPDTVFKGSKGECKRADFVIVSNDSKKWIICIETQTGNYKERREVIEQLRGALCFVNYCKCIGKEFWREDEFLDGYQYRFISMAYTSIHKRSTQFHDSRTLHSRPENFRKVFGKSHYFSWLV